MGAKLKELPSSIKDERMDVILAVKKELKDSYISANLGKVLEVIPEDLEGEYLVGYTENYIKVYLNRKDVNSAVKVKLAEAYKEGAIGEIV